MKAPDSTQKRISAMRARLIDARQKSREKSSEKEDRTVSDLIARAVASEDEADDAQTEEVQTNALSDDQAKNIFDAEFEKLKKIHEN